VCGLGWDDERPVVSAAGRNCQAVLWRNQSQEVDWEMGRECRDVAGFSSMRVAHTTMRAGGSRILGKGLEISKAVVHADSCQA
jgi:hypothetical protein